MKKEVYISVTKQTRRKSGSRFIFLGHIMNHLKHMSCGFGRHGSKILVNTKWTNNNHHHNLHQSKKVVRFTILQLEFYTS